jgi:hypothetical protein
VNRRAVIIGVQTAAVALCVVIVYITLLRPDSTAPLHGIQAPPDGKPPRADVTHRHEGPHKPDEGRAHGAAGGVGTAGGGAGAGIVGAVAPATTPTGDQYSDAVSLLLSRVHTADSTRGPGSG